MTAETIAKALDGRKAGGCWMARCPAHDDRKPSLSITDSQDGKVLVRCHAGCDQDELIAALRMRGIWGTADRRGGRSRRENGRCPALKRDPDALTRTQAALAIWRASQPAEGTPVETYLRSRGLLLSPPPAIRFHAGLKHPSGGVWPAMVALVTRGADGAPLALHRTFLARDGGSKAPEQPSKMMLGPCRGGAVRLGEARDGLMVGEGIETCLAAQQATGPFAGYAPDRGPLASGGRTQSRPLGLHEVEHVTAGAAGGSGMAMLPNPCAAGVLR